jgi:hypothetical protein
MCEVSGELTVTLITLVVAKVRESLAVSNHATQRLDMERVYLRKLYELDVRKRYQI